MFRVITFRVARLVIVLLVLCMELYCFSQPTNKEKGQTKAVTSWNRVILETAVEEDGLLTLKGVRTASMAHVAMHDVLNSIKPEFSTWNYKKKHPGADPLTGVVQAAYEIAVDQYPDQRERFLDLKEQCLNYTEKTHSITEGINLGREVAKSILEARATDRWDGESEYSLHPMGPGVYAEFNEHSNTPEGFVFGAGWAKAGPFLIPSSSYFRVPAPPGINSSAYTAAYNEVKEYGRTSSASRTPDQAHLAMWAKDFIENSHNRLARKLVVGEGLDLWRAARLFALMNMSIYDAYVNVFDNKFFYNHWRPYTAIRWAAHDGNPDTVPDTTWNNLHKHTYAFPSYPSAHGAASGAAMTVLAQTLGKGDEFEFTMEIAEVDKAGPFSEKIEMNPSVRRFSSFSEAGKAISLSRIYLGIHFRYDSEEGYELGRQIGDYAVQNYLKPVNGIEGGH